LGHPITLNAKVEGDPKLQLLAGIDFTLRDGRVEEACPVDIAPQSSKVAHKTSNDVCCNVLLSGGLQAHENLGGHTIDRHVGKSDDELLARLAAEPSIPAASTFNTLAEANSATVEALRSSQKEICSWLSSSISSLTLTYAKEGGSVGRVMLRGAMSSYPGSQVRLVLRSSTNSPIGFYVLTSFPLP